MVMIQRLGQKLYIKDRTGVSVLTHMWMMSERFVGLIVSKQRNPDTALSVFTELLVPVMDKHAPVRKLLELLGLPGSMMN